jgi:hypothetical protein
MLNTSKLLFKSHTTIAAILDGGRGHRTQF